MSKIMPYSVVLSPFSIIIKMKSAIFSEIFIADYFINLLISVNEVNNLDNLNNLDLNNYNNLKSLIFSEIFIADYFINLWISVNEVNNLGKSNVLCKGIYGWKSLETLGLKPYTHRSFYLSSNRSGSNSLTFSTESLFTLSK